MANRPAARRPEAALGPLRVAVARDTGRGRDLLLRRGAGPVGRRPRPSSHAGEVGTGAAPGKRPARPSRTVRTGAGGRAPLTARNGAVSISRTEARIVHLGHISDLHVGERARYPRHGIAARECDRHSVKLLRKILQALQEEAVDHLLVTGDVTLSGEAAEFERVAELLAPWAEAGRLTVLPGNHDVWSYEAASTWRFLRALGHDGRGMRKPVAVFPLAVELSPEVTLLALDSARHGEDPYRTPGALGSEQLAATRELAREAVRQGRAVVLALHHHIVIPPERVDSDLRLARMPLSDAYQVVRLVAELPIAAVLHGHRHTSFRLDLPGASGPTPVLCAGSASRVASEPVRRPRALVYELDRTGLRSVAALVASA